MRFMLYYKSVKMSIWNPHHQFEADSAEEAFRYAELCQKTDQLNRLFMAAVLLGAKTAIAMPVGIIAGIFAWNASRVTSKDDAILKCLI
jgi:hypothetical protein